MLESICSITIGDRVWVSNSVPFLLAATGSSLDKEYFHYEEDFCSGMKGVRNSSKSTPLSVGRELRFHRSCNVEVDAQLTVNEKTKHSELDFHNYDAYMDSLRKVLRRIKENATDRARKTPYGMVTTISRGYDAPAASALAFEVGCRIALTFNTPERYKDDCGSEIARRLGYSEIHELDGEEYLRNTALLEAESCSTGNAGTSIIFLPYEKLYRGKLLFRGTRGDSLWARAHKNVNDEQDFTSENQLVQSDSAFTENMLRNNTVIINVPMIGCDRWTEIDRLSSSSEMDTWSVGGDYDRPIPRRIVEEKGVERTAFGQKKTGVGITYHFDTLRRVGRRMSPVSYSSLLSYKKNLKRNGLSYALYAMKCYTKDLPMYLNYLTSKLRIPLHFSTEGCGKMSSPISTVLILWGMDVMVNRYKEKIAKGMETADGTPKG